MSGCPPGTCVSIMWPTWAWAREPFPGKPHNPALEGPGTKWVFSSYADELRTKHSLDRRKMLQSEWYRTRWPKPAELTGDQNVKTLFTNSSSGQMFATIMTGAGTGLGGNYIVIDDPHKTKEESTSADVKAQVAVYGDTFATRHDDKKQGVTVINIINRVARWKNRVFCRQSKGGLCIEVSLNLLLRRGLGSAAHILHN
jgi:hypothetical protein